MMPYLITSTSTSRYLIAVWSITCAVSGCSKAAPSTAEPDADAGVSVDAGLPPQAEFLDIPPGFPVPVVPEDNPLSVAKIELGRHLFYDTRLSANGTQSCASCHEQAKAFTDGRALAQGSTGEQHPRSSMSLANVAYLNVLTWGNPLMDTLETQALVPMFGKEPVELGLVDESALVTSLSTEPYYAEAFAEAFPGDADPLTLRNIVHALSSFERTLISGRSPYDRWLEGEEGAISPAAVRGYDLFNGHPFECFHCHGTFNFNDSITYVGNEGTSPLFHNTGLYNIDGQGAYPAPNTGVYEITGHGPDMGNFRAPTLRNISVTAPYMHDGSIATLSDVLDHYAAGGRHVTEGPNLGEGSSNPLKSNLLTGFELSEQERADAIAFLESLTDEAFLTDPRFGNPWDEGARESP
jgi:cytochrome c peroxidase